MATQVAKLPIATAQPTLDFITPLSTNSTTVSVDLGIMAPFAAIRNLLDHPQAQPATHKKAALSNRFSVQKSTVDLSLSAHGFGDVLSFFDIVRTMVPSVLLSLRVLAAVGLAAVHEDNMNLRL